jgi:hypothetical protein
MVQYVTRGFTTSRDLLTAAADEVGTASGAVPDSELRERLEVLAGQLRSQAEREVTPALGVLDRVQTKLRGIQRQTNDATATAAIERARDDIPAFLDTLDDREMKRQEGAA